ncbi:MULTISPECIES: carbon-nitrogen hydrolase family protein [unclassified Myroides]|uniref:carbon-nitrogen hydrolase family protein n=1 Tax=unclassified Myroides TaxID=2642485 RepID=UPI003D2F5D6A
MRVGFFQYAVIWRNIQANLDYIAAAVQHEKFDLLVLPEFFTTGYAMDTKEEILPFVEDLKNSTTVQFLAQLLEKTGNGLITGTIPEIDNGILYNTAILVSAQGLVSSYRKIHLPDYEKRFFQPGDQAVVYESEQAKIGLTICFDCWFPQHTSMLKRQKVEIICHSSCFGGPVTPTIIPIRALENQCFYISCNRIGQEYFETELESYRGESQLVDPDGNPLVKASNDEHLALVDIDLNTVNHPNFGSLITEDFQSEHDKYKIVL